MKTILFALIPALLFAQTASFPTAVATDAQLKIRKNGITTSLRASARVGDSVITVADCSGLEANMLLTIGRREVVNITAVSGCALTVTRGFDGTTAVNHSAGAEVAQYPTAWDTNAIKAEVVAIQSSLGPNLSNVIGGGSGVITSSTYNFAAQTPGSTLTASVINVVNMSPCPVGVAGTNTNHRLYISGGVGAAESVQISGGTCTSGAPSGTLTFTPANAHSGAWTISSATAGIREALQVAGVGGAVGIPAGTVTVTGPVTIPHNNQTLGCVTPGCTLKMANGANASAVINASNIEGFRLYGVTVDANWSQQTSGQNNGLLLSVCKRCRIEANTFRAAGRGWTASGYVAQAILGYNNPDLQIVGNKFQSNRGADIGLTYSGTSNIYANDGLLVDGNTFGTASLLDSNSNVEWWDTRSAGHFVLSVTGARGCVVSNNQVYGQTRDHLDIGTRGNGFAFSGVRHCTVSNNKLHGIANGLGTIAVTNGSTAITGTNTYFSTFATSSLATEAGAYLEIEGDNTLYRINGACGSETSCTVTPAVTRSTASGLRYRINYGADLIGFFGSYSVVANNTTQYSRDVGMGVGCYDSGCLPQDVVFTGNHSSFNGTAGFAFYGNASNITVVGNDFSYNAQGLPTWSATFPLITNIQFETATGLGATLLYTQLNISNNIIACDGSFSTYALGIGTVANVQNSTWADNETSNCFSGYANVDMHTAFAKAQFRSNQHAGKVYVGPMSAGASPVSPTVSGTGRAHFSGNTVRPFDAARTPATAAESCNAGEVAFDASYIYVCTAANAWKRSAIATW